MSQLSTQTEGTFSTGYQLCAQILALPSSIPRHGNMCDFLTEQFETENKAYSTINSYKSALSSILPPVEGKLLGEHPVIVRLLKGMYVTCPPQSRYTTTWDVNILLNCLETWDPLGDLTLKQLAIKTVALVALVSAQRSQTLAALRLDFMHETANSIQFVIQDILKTSRPGKRPLSVLLPAFPDNPKLCVYSAVCAYIARTQTVRETLKTTKLFISYGWPYKVVCASTIACWLNSALDLSGIDTNIFRRLPRRLPVLVCPLTLS